MRIFSSRGASDAVMVAGDQRDHQQIPLAKLLQFEVGQCVPSLCGRAVGIPLLIPILLDVT